MLRNVYLCGKKHTMRTLILVLSLTVLVYYAGTMRLREGDDLS